MKRTHRQIHSRRLLIAAALLAVAGAAHAAVISAQPRKEFQRLSIDFGQPVRMQVQQGSGEVTLRFNTKLDAGVDSIPAKLKPYVTGARLSPDGLALTLRMNKQYRVRQFISGNTVGVDFLTSSPAAPVPAAAPEPAADMLSTKQAAPTEPVETSVLSTKPAPEPKPAPTPKPVLAPKPVVEKPVTPPKAAAPAPEKKPAADTMLTTKRDEPPAAPPAPPEKKPELPVTKPADELLTTKREEPPAPAPVVEAPKSAEKPAAIPTAKEEPKAPEAAAPVEKPKTTPAVDEPKIDPKRPFIVTAKQTSDGTTLRFPWNTRTAAAVFENARDIWVIFSQETDVKPALVATLLPKQIVKLEQYKLPGSTVLRFVTDGTVHATATQPKGDYAWEMMFGPVPMPATLDIPLRNDLLDKKRYLQLEAYDTGEPLQFVDPTTDDLWLVVPTFEQGRGIAVARNFPSFDLLAAPQGLAINAQRPDLKLSKQRNGLRLIGGTSLAVSEHLNAVTTSSAAPVSSAASTSGVMFPYDLWFVAPKDWRDQHAARLQALADASPAQMPESMQRLTELYLGQGLALEARGYLKLIEQQHPEFYKEKRLALLAAAAEMMMNHMPEAAEAVSAPELDGMGEAEMWRKLISVYTPVITSDVEKLTAEAEKKAAELAQKAAEEAAANAPASDTPATVAPPPLPPQPKTFNYLAYQRPYLRFYPPRIKQRMAVLSAEAYLDNNQPAEAVKIYEQLNREGLIGPVQPYAEFAIASNNASKSGKKPKEVALETFDRLASSLDQPYIATRARYAAAMQRFASGEWDAQQTINELEKVKIAWRGDQLQRDVLASLANIYRDNKRYDDTLRTWKYLLDNFPADPETLTLSGDMATLFNELFSEGLADDMPPLKSLALFYEFRELTPIGEQGDAIIQKLADRLAAVDLIDRATQLLEHQIRFRVSGEERARVGARLALLYLLNKQPKQALATLESTNFGDAADALKRQRAQLTAQALSDDGKREEALSMLFNDDSREADLLRLDILWAMKDWPNVINQAEDILSSRPNLTSKLDNRETEVLMKLVLGYSFEGDHTQLRYLRDYYSALLPETRYKEIFAFMTNDTAPLDPEDFDLVAKQISNTESFLDVFRKQIAEGNLSETVK